LGMESNTTRLVLHIDGGADADMEELARLTDRLRADLLELDVDAVDRVHSGASPAGAKGDPVTLAALAVTLAPIALTGLMKALQTWSARHDGATVTVESDGRKIVVTGSPSKEQRQMVESFLAGHN
jgi:hypothetical protein